MSDWLIHLDKVLQKFYDCPKWSFDHICLDNRRTPRVTHTSLISGNREYLSFWNEYDIYFIKWNVKQWQSNKWRMCKHFSFQKLKYLSVSWKKNEFIFILYNLKTYDVLKGIISFSYSLAKTNIVVAQKSHSLFLVQNIYCFCLFDLILYVSVNSYGHVEMVSSPDHTFPGQAWLRV